MQLQIFFKKGCELYAVRILDLVEGKGPSLEDYKVLWEYANVFPDEVLRLPLEREIDFTLISCQEQC